MNKKLAVFCGARDGSDPKYLKMAREFGDHMVAHHLDLVYGGGRFGIMGTVAGSVLDNGGRSYGAITKELSERGAGLTRLTKLYIVKNMAERKMKMMNMADAMVALPGGLGTLEEVIQAASWTAVGDNNKPVIIFNFDHFYDHLHEELVEMNKAGFLEDSFLDACYFTDSFDKMLEFINSYKAPQFRTYN